MFLPSLCFQKSALDLLNVAVSFKKGAERAGHPSLRSDLTPGTAVLMPIEVMD
jgi:hypothetical protein